MSLTAIWARTSARLENAGYVEIEKSFVGKKPRTRVSLTRAGAAPSTPTFNTCRTSSMLQVDCLSKRYGERVAVNAISFRIAQGETVGLLGPNGAGKTTAIAMISGISRPDSGKVRLGGMSLTRMPMH